MTDPRLNSVHLDAPRRQEFRSARDLLLRARGHRTLFSEGQPAAAELDAGLTHGEIRIRQREVAARFYLMDQTGVYPLKVGLNTVGRMPDNDVVLEDAYVSRRHCAVLVHASDTCELHDVASKNGTFLNGRKIDGPTRLNSGDEIRMCNKNLIFVSQAADGDDPSQATFAE